MVTRQLSRIALGLAAAALAAACSTNETRVPQVNERPAEPATTEAPAAEAPAAEAPAPEKPAIEHSEAEVSAPFVLALKGPENAPETGDIELTATITAKRELKAPATIAITVPTGAKLVAGKETETLPTLPAGELVRVFRVTTNGKLDQPVKVTVDVKHPQGVFGAHAERTYPEQKVEYARPSKNVPPPPVGRPPVGRPPTR